MKFRMRRANQSAMVTHGNTSPPIQAPPAFHARKPRPLEWHPENDNPTQKSSNQRPQSILYKERRGMGWLKDATLHHPIKLVFAWNRLSATMGMGGTIWSGILIQVGFHVYWLLILEMTFTSYWKNGLDHLWNHSDVIQENSFDNYSKNAFKELFWTMKICSL